MIGQQLLQEAADAGVEVVLNATVIGMYLDKEIVVRIKDEVHHYKGDSIIIATGAAENMVTFEGLESSGSHRRRSRTDDDESARGKTGKQNSDAWFRKCRSGRILPADAVRL